MKVGSVKEIKRHEYRVGLTPANAKAYMAAGHSVLLEKGAGINAGFEDSEYEAAGVELVGDRKEVFDRSDMIVKVKEPQPEEFDLFKEGQILYTYLHLAAEEELTKALRDRKIKGIAYETIETANGQLPLLKPMSEIAGRLSVQEGAKFLERPFGGRGVLLGGVPGVERGKVAILGGGVVGTNAAKMAVGLGAEVTVLDVNVNRLEYLDDIFGGRISTLYSNQGNIDKVLEESDLLVGAVLIPGAKAPHLIKKEDLKKMKKGSVIVDVAVDQGGCIETTKPTTHDEPTFAVHDVVHYCVANMPGAVARTSTMALTNVTLSYGLQIADKGLEAAAKENESLKLGINLYNGKLTYKAVAEAFGMDYTAVDEAI
ncbi:MAG: alanine dehydrogenase [Spirochaetaceae bacterium]|nr:alanine dehydrogenase [Spirochaetaceae bacterium]MCF7938915.1 alanine dehydrogenase [Spirochaetales bacterium]